MSWQDMAEAAYEQDSKKYDRMSEDELLTKFKNYSDSPKWYGSYNGDICILSSLKGKGILDQNSKFQERLNPLRNL